MPTACQQRIKYLKVQEEVLRSCLKVQEEVLRSCCGRERTEPYLEGWVGCIFEGFHGEEVWEWAGREDVAASS